MTSQRYCLTTHKGTTADKRSILAFVGTHAEVAHFLAGWFIGGEGGVPKAYDFFK